jgi:hypothetical protein
LGLPLGELRAGSDSSNLILRRLRSDRLEGGSREHWTLLRGAASRLLLRRRVVYF